MNKVIRLMVVMVLVNGAAMSQTDRNYIPKPVPKVDTIMQLQYVEQQPTFPGGDSLINKFLYDNLKYPELALKTNIQGKVFVTFVVNSNGKISDVKVIRGIGGGCDEEAIRLIKSMPNWIPGKYNGKNVPVQMNLPVKFLFDEKNKPLPIIQTTICH
jgi:protein TonB